MIVNYRDWGYVKFYVRGIRIRLGLKFCLILIGFRKVCSSRVLVVVYSG